MHKNLSKSRYFLCILPLHRVKVQQFTVLKCAFQPSLLLPEPTLAHMPIRADYLVVWIWAGGNRPSVGYRPSSQLFETKKEPAADRYRLPERKCVRDIIYIYTVILLLDGTIINFTRLALRAGFVSLIIRSLRTGQRPFVRNFDPRERPPSFLQKLPHYIRLGGG